MWARCKAPRRHGVAWTRESCNAPASTRMAKENALAWCGRVGARTLPQPETRPERGVSLATRSDMSVKKMLPVLGVGSAVALLGLAAVRRQRIHNDALGTRERRMASGVHPRVVLDDVDGEAPVSLESELWRAAPESDSLMERAPDSFSPMTPTRAGAPAEETYDALDTEDLTVEWLARATEAPASRDDDVDDPAEIPVDSISMISDASRRAAGYEIDELEPTSEYDPARRS
jgi:hypothetical protein